MKLCSHARFQNFFPSVPICAHLCPSVPICAHLWWQSGFAFLCVRMQASSAVPGKFEILMKKSGVATPYLPFVKFGSFAVPIPHSTGDRLIVAAFGLEPRMERGRANRPGEPIGRTDAGNRTGSAGTPRPTSDQSMGAERRAMDGPLLPA